MQNYITHNIRGDNTSEKEKIRGLIKRKDDINSAEREKKRDPIKRKDDMKSDWSDSNFARLDIRYDNFGVEGHYHPKSINLCSFHGFWSEVSEWDIKAILKYKCKKILAFISQISRLQRLIYGPLLLIKSEKGKYFVQWGQ